jgi:hypothetical protein
MGNPSLWLHTSTVFALYKLCEYLTLLLIIPGHWDIFRLELATKTVVEIGLCVGHFVLLPAVGLSRMVYLTFWMALCVTSLGAYVYFELGAWDSALQLRLVVDTALPLLLILEVVVLVAAGNIRATPAFIFTAIVVLTWLSQQLNGWHALYGLLVAVVIGGGLLLVLVPPLSMFREAERDGSTL